MSEKNDSGQYQCPVCKYVQKAVSEKYGDSQRKQRMKSHILSKHVKKITKACIHCKKTFTRNEQLTYHIFNHHKALLDLELPEKPFKCSTCNKTFIAKYDLTKHKRTHDEEPKLKCSKSSGLPRFST